ncbi:MAG: cupin domain-containing protein [Alphaproteobacteria bacterium]|nr:cupin domain-containing protein [Alphaproteobacteria bacterium]
MDDIYWGKPARDGEEYNQALRDLSQRRTPTVFGLRVQLPTQGRVDLPLASTEGMTIVLKAYAGGGENALHAHQHEDHAFVVLQGSATFYGPEDRVIAELTRYQGILIPKGALYRFHAHESESLVMLRIGALDAGTFLRSQRVNEKGGKQDGFSKENKEVPVLYAVERWFQA